MIDTVASHKDNFCRFHVIQKISVNSSQETEFGLEIMEKKLQNGLKVKLSRN